MAILSAQARAGAVGFEPAAEDESRTLDVGDMTAMEVLDKVRDFAVSL